MDAWCRMQLAGSLAGLCILFAVVPAAAEPPAIDSDPAFIIAYMKGFIAGCSKSVQGNPDIGKIACSCAAAVIADRFTITELKSVAGKGIGDYDKVHAGTSKLIGVCGQTAKVIVGN